MIPNKQKILLSLYMIKRNTNPITHLEHRYNQERTRLQASKKKKKTQNPHYVHIWSAHLRLKQTKTNKLKLRGLSLRPNYTDQATATCHRSWCQLLRTEGIAWSAQQILDRSRYFFLPSSSSIVLVRLGGPCSRPTTSPKIWQRQLRLKQKN
jgi:hypothetical protein